MNNHLNPQQIISQISEPFYYLVIRSKLFNCNNCASKIVSEGFSVLNIKLRGGKITSKVSPIASICIPDIGDFNNYIDGSGEIEGVGCLYLFSNKLEAYKFLDKH